MRFFTADTHFNHCAILKYCKRPFSGLYTMNAEMKYRWNSIVRKKDIVYHIGDFGFGSSKYLASLIKQLNGTIYLIRGTHDKNIKKEVLDIPNFHDLGYYYELFIPDSKIKNKQIIVLCHYPLETWYKSHYGSLHFHGHCHNQLKHIIKNRIDVGVDGHDFYPDSLENWVKLLNKRDNEKILDN